MKKICQNADFRLHERAIFLKIALPWVKKMIETCT